ncbi:hypothetical protein L7F22_040190 [Adiantum nelumboides]|nr:hypothetical protein [Adiantum nelumboides]
MDTRLQFSSSFHPQTDGQSEIANSVVLDLLKSYISDQRTHWERYLPLVEFAYNNTIHSSAGKAPFEIVEGAMKVLPFLSTKDKIFEADEYTKDLDTAFAKVRETFQKSQERQKKATDRHRRDLKLKENDWVLLRFEKARLRKKKGKGEFFFSPKLNSQCISCESVEIFGDVPDDGKPDEQLAVEQNESIFVHEQVLAHKVTKKGKARRRFLIKFKNFPAFDAKWMEEEDKTPNNHFKTVHSSHRKFDTGPVEFRAQKYWPQRLAPLSWYQSTTDFSSTRSPIQIFPQHLWLQANPSTTSRDAGGDHNEDYGDEYGSPLPTEEELHEMEHRRLVSEATNMMLNFAKDPKLANYMTETAFQDVHAQWKATTTSPPKPDTKKQYSEKELEEEVEARLAQNFDAHKKGKKHGRKRRKSTDFPGYLDHLAACEGHTECLSLLINKGADVNRKDNFGVTPLFDALRAGQDSTAQILVESGAKTHLEDAGIELCRAAASGDIPYLSRLVKYGVDPNASDYGDRTPLHVAAAEGNTEAAAVLVREGADVLAKDRRGFTPLDEARVSDDQATIRFLENEVSKRQGSECPFSSDVPMRQQDDEEDA